MKIRISKALICGALTAASALPLAAQDDSTQATTADDTANVLRLDDEVTTASRGKRDPQTVPADITVIDRAMLDTSTATNLTDVLRQQAGVAVHDLYGNGAKASVSLIGMGNGETDGLNTAILIDGVRADFADLAAFDWSTIPLDQVERVEVRRGGGGSLYGDNATGGVISITTRKGNGRRATAGVEVDSYGYRTNLSLGWSEADWSALIQESYLDSNGYRSNSEHRNHVQHLSLAYQPDDKMFGFSAQAGYQQEDAGLPGDLTAAQIATLGRRASDTPMDDFDMESAYVVFTPRLQLGDDHLLQLGTSWRERHTHALAMYGGFPFRSIDHQMTVSLAPQYTYTGDVAGRANTFTTGVDYHASDMNGIENRTDASQYRLEYYVHDSLEVLPKLFLDGGYRYAQIDNSFAGLGKSDDELHAWDAGLTWNYAPDSKVFASISQAYRTPVLDEYTIYLGFTPALNANLKSQVTRTAQIGVRHHVNDLFVPSLTLFASETKDEIFYDPSSGSIGQNDNYDEVQRHGAILAVESQPCERVRLTANYTYLDTELGANDAGNFDGNRMPMNARHSAGATAVVTLPLGFTWTSDVHWTDSQFTIGDVANASKKMDGYTVANTRLGYTWKYLTVYGGVNNLFDQQYSEYVTYGANYYPSPERSFVAGLQISLAY